MSLTRRQGALTEYPAGWSVPLAETAFAYALPLRKV